MPLLPGKVSTHHSNSNISNISLSITNDDSSSSSNNSNADVLNLAFVTCGSKSRLEEVLIMLKSALIFSEVPINFILFTDSLEPEIREALEAWNKTERFQKITLDARIPSKVGSSFRACVWEEGRKFILIK